MTNYIVPTWPVPKHIRALITTRTGGVSRRPYESFNLASHVDDCRNNVEQNRRTLYQSLGQNIHDITWIQQVHGTTVHSLNTNNVIERGIKADGVTSSEHNIVCAIQTADCLPILLCDREGTQVAALHAGWRGLVNGIISQGVSAFAKASSLFAYLGPAISQDAFEVGRDVYQACLDAEAKRRFSEPVAASFRAAETDGKFFLDLYRLARAELQALGVSAIYGGEYCTFKDSARFYSYRRDGETGRMASLIWIDKDT